MHRRRAAAAWALVVGTLCWPSCAPLPPEDPFAPGEQQARAGAFLPALVLLDQVPPAHPRYAEARSLAQAIERRVRISHDLLLQGLTMRSEWRDEEALRLFEQALGIWPSVPSAPALISATKARIRAIDHVEKQSSLPEARTTAVLPNIVSSASQRVGKIAGRLGEDHRVVDVPAAPGADPLPLPRAGRLGRLDQERQHRHLQQAQEYMERGEIPKAMDLLEGLHQNAPDDVSITQTLTRLLHQRALLRYGQGWLELAAADWARILELEPGSVQAAEFRKAASAEISQRKRP